MFPFTEECKHMDCKKPPVFVMPVVIRLFRYPQPEINSKESRKKVINRRNMGQLGRLLTQNGDRKLIDLINANFDKSEAFNISNLVSTNNVSIVQII